MMKFLGSNVSGLIYLKSLGSTGSAPRRTLRPDGIASVGCSAVDVVVDSVDAVVVSPSKYCLKNLLNSLKKCQKSPQKNPFYKILPSGITEVGFGASVVVVLGTGVV